MTALQLPLPGFLRPYDSRRYIWDPYELQALLWEMIEERGSATVEDVYDRYGVEPANARVGPEAVQLLQVWHPSVRIVGKENSRRPSRKGAPVARWGTKP